MFHVLTSCLCMCLYSGYMQVLRGIFGEKEIWFGRRGRVGRIAVRLEAIHVVISEKTYFKKKLLTESNMKFHTVKERQFVTLLKIVCETTTILVKSTNRCCITVLNRNYLFQVS